MKPITSDVTTSGSLGKHVPMTFDEESFAHLMSLFTSAYSDNELAVIREYSTNGWDSHVAAGNTHIPIEVTTPNHMQPNFVVQDFGTGLSAEEMEDILSKYGASTKRGSNAQTGTLGIGCKSGLAIASQFTMTAVKDGLKTLVTFGIDDDGVGAIDILDPEPTSEPNGVKVVIPLPHSNSIGAKAVEFFRFWKPGTVLLNGKEPSLISGTAIDTDMLLVSGLENDVIVQGNVPYRINSEYSIVSDYRSGYGNKIGLVIFAPIGSVDFTPSREDLKYVEHTKKFIKAAQERFLSLLKTSIEKEVDACATAGEALVKSRALNKQYHYVRGFKYVKVWRGIDIPTRFPDLKYIQFKPEASRNQITSRTGIDAADVVESIFVVGMPDIQLSSFYKSKIRTLLSDNNIQTGYYTKVIVVRESTPIDEWFGAVTTFTWDQVKAVKTKSSTSSRSKSRPIKLLDGGEWRGWSDISYDDLDNSKPIYYGSSTEWDSARYLLDIFDGDEQVVLLAPNRWDKLTRLFPGAQKIRDGIAQKSQEFTASLQPEVIELIRLTNTGIADRLDEARVDDPELVAEIKTLKVKVPTETLNKISRFGVRQKFTTKRSVISKYPMVDQFHLNRYPDHVYTYINAMYAKEGKK